jgi:hypothetical protein
MNTIKVGSGKVAILLKIAIVVQILSSTLFLITLILEANLSDPNLPTKSCPDGTDFLLPMKIRDLCGTEKELLYVPQWARTLLPVSLVSMLICMIMVILLIVWLNRKGELGSAQKKVLRISIITFILTFILFSFIFTLPFVVAEWLPGPEPIY